MSKVSALINTYEKHISVPWQQSLAGSQRVLFAVYDKTDEFRLRAHVTEFELATRDAGHDWHLIDLTDVFPNWMVGVKYKESYFENPDDLDGYQVGEVTEFTSDLIKSIKTDLESNQNPNQVTALLGVGALFGLSHVSTVVNGIASSISGRLLVFFPGEYENNTYRLLDARDGWNYLAVPILADH
ncbi:MAG: DUF1788 domain-containing protein [Gammaproteobacteria bacterium]|nr:DUF1788 domain-containing protein [Gammaproteobacteria bacterium]